MSQENPPSSGWFWSALPLPAAMAAEATRLSAGWQILLALAINLLTLALPVMSVQIYDRIVPNAAYATLALLVAGVITALLMEGFLRMARGYLAGWMAATQEHVASRAGLDRLMRADLVAYGKKGISSHLQNFTAFSRLREYYGGQTLGAVADLPFVGVFLALLAYIGGKLCYVPLGLLVVFLVLAIYAGHRLRRALAERSETDSRKFNYILAILAGVHRVKALGMETSVRRRFETLQAAGTERSYQVAKASGFAGSVSAAFSQLSMILTVTAGSYLVLRGEMTVGGLSACTLLAGRCLQPVQRVLGTWLRLQDLALARQHARSLLTMPAQTRSDRALPPPQGTVTLTDVSFRYDNAHAPVLQNVSLNVFRGETIAIVAEKGSGKSTLLQLIAGLLPPQSGDVRIDGINPVEYATSDMRKHVGYLPQRGSIYKGTILENLCGFEEDEEIVENVKAHCERLGLDSVIDQLQKGYNTPLNDGWADPVPPGVKQRIALARALRHNPSLVLFDDADQALDKEGYNRLFGFIGRLKRRATLIIVSQDANLLTLAERSFRLEDGTLRPIEATETAASFLSQFSLGVRR